MAERTPLVLLPGLLCDAALWRAQTDALADVAAPHVPDLTGRDSVADLAAEVLSEAPGRFALAGLSMGGYVAFEVLRQAPERVTRLALLDTNPYADDEARADGRRAQIALAREGRFRAVMPRLLPRLLHPDRLADRPLVATVTGMAERVGPGGFQRQQTAIMTRPDSRPLLPEIAVPTLVLCGSDDALSPPAVHEEMARAIPGAEFVIVEDAGHLAPLERPEPVSRSLRSWLTARPGAG